MTSLMHWVRRTDTRRGVGAIAGATFVLALAGCNEDRASDANAKEPIAVTASGVEIMEVVKREDTRTVEAVVVTGGEERQVTLAPILDGPSVSGVSARVESNGGEPPVELAYGFDEVSGATWFRYATSDYTFTLERVVVGGRVVEDYACDGRSLRLEYADLSPAEADKVIGKYLRGESLASASPNVSEFAEQARAFDEFTGDLPTDLLSSDVDGSLLASLMGDRTFANAVIGNEPQRRPDGLCRFFNVCAAFSCRLIHNVHVCTVCLAGSLACLFMDFFCTAWCGGGN